MTIKHRVYSGRKTIIKLSRYVRLLVKIESLKIKNKSLLPESGQLNFQLAVDDQTLGASLINYNEKEKKLDYRLASAYKQLYVGDMNLSCKLSSGEPGKETILLDKRKTLNRSTMFHDGVLQKFESDDIEIIYSIEKIKFKVFDELKGNKGNILQMGGSNDLSDTFLAIYKSPDGFDGTVGWISEKLAPLEQKGSYLFDYPEYISATDNYYVLPVKKDHSGTIHQITHSPQKTDLQLKPDLSSFFGKVIDEITDEAIPNIKVSAYNAWLKNITKNLKCFEKPDTKSKELIELREGNYEIRMLMDGYPNWSKDSEFIKIRFIQDDKVGEGWICSRWKRNHYAVVCYDKIIESTTKADGKFKFDTLPGLYYKFKTRQQTEKLGNCFDYESSILPIARFMSEKPEGLDLKVKVLDPDDKIYLINEFKITNLFRYFKGVTYKHENEKPNYPFKKIGQFTPKLYFKDGIPYKRNDCSTFAEALLGKAWERSNVPQWIWKKEIQHNKFVLAQIPVEHFSPIELIKDSNMGEIIDADAFPPAWCIVQGWDEKLEKGHTFIIADTDVSTQRVLILDSNIYNSTYKNNGPGFRFFGNLYSGSNPINNWWAEIAKEELADWEEIKKNYPNRKIAKLYVFNKTKFEKLRFT